MKPLWNKRLVMLLITFCALWGKAQAEQPIDTSSSANILVTNRGDSGAGSFRQAITTSNSNGTTDNIIFHDSLKGATIKPLSQLPSLTEGGTTINGDVDGNATPDIEIDGSLAGQGEGINILSSNNVIRGLVINRTYYSGIGIHTSAATYNTIAGNYIGLDKTGTIKLGTSNAGVCIGEGAHRNTIGGEQLADRNIISGNYNGVFIYSDSDNNQIINNFVGTDKTGIVAFGNTGEGIYVFSRYNLIKNNLVSGNSGTWNGGITLWGSQAYENTVVGNFIGTDVSGTNILGNTGAGVGIYSGAHDNIIGGTNPGEGNLLSGNGNGIGIDGIGSDGNIILGNLIGTDTSGTEALPNDHGVVITGGAKSNTIGGTTLGASNLISGNKYRGIEIYDNGSDRNVVLGNLIGTNVYGTMALPNATGGIAIYGGAMSNIIGGIVLGAGNLISGNGVGEWAAGILIANVGTDSNLVFGNKIGTNKGGIFAIGNRNDGVNINNGPKHNQIGGSDSLAGNLISGNGDPSVQWSGYGITIAEEGTEYNRILGNRIGTDVYGTVAVPNLIYGILITNGASSNIIGGNTSAHRNLVSGNTYQGIVVYGAGTRNNQIMGNYIGTDAAGTVAIPNGRIPSVEGLGIVIQGGAKANQIGGADTGAGNLISGNKGSGILINFPGADSNRIIGNYIGTTADGLSPLPNGANGIFIRESACYNQIGGIISGEGNLISGNKGSGIKISHSGTRDNQIMRNEIHSNQENGISILNPGTNQNLISSNYIFNNTGTGIYYYPDYKFPFSPPVIQSVTASQISGYASLPNGSKVELFSDTDDEGKIYIDSATVLNNSFTYSGTIPAWTHLTATGIDTAGNTSTFSVPFFSRPVQTIPYFNNFETNDGNFAHQGTWAWGEPTYGPKQAYSGRKVWATTLDSVTLNYNYQYLELPPIHLNSPICACLSFAHWHSFEKLYDGGNVKISSDDGKHFTLITPDSGYDCTLGYVMLGESTFNGESGRYIREFFNLGPYANDTVIIRFHFASDPWIQQSGWYIDDLSLFLRGDANSDKQLTVADVVYLVSYIFKRGAQPRPLEAGDANRDGKVNIADIVYLVAYLFKAGAPPAC